jgi:hypothetical protein
MAAPPQAYQLATQEFQKLQQRQSQALQLLILTSSIPDCCLTLSSHPSTLTEMDATIAARQKLDYQQSESESVLKASSYSSEVTIAIPSDYLFVVNVTGAQGTETSQYSI